MTPLIDPPNGRWHLRTHLAGWFACACIVLAWHAVFFASNEAVPAAFIQTDVRAEPGTIVQVFWDNGPGIREVDSLSLVVPASPEGTYRVRAPIPNGVYRRVRFDFSNTIEFSDLQIVRPDGGVIHTLTDSMINRRNAIASIDRHDDRITAIVEPGEIDPYLLFTPPGRRIVLSVLSNPATTIVMRALTIGAFIWLAAWGMMVAVRRPGSWFVSREWSSVSVYRRSPMLVILCISTVSVLVACHPIVFLGRSFVSPEIGAPMLYHSNPTVPGFVEEKPVEVRGADIGAIMWAHLPYSEIESRAILDDHELPLWNRYNSCGTSLIGQGQSMLGDPLHFLVILAGGASWAWDGKFVVARILFAFGAGVIAWILTRRLGIACLIASAAAFIGYFNGRVNHPAIFSVSYAPWILVGWCGVANDADPRRQLRWFWIILVASITVLTSGTAKEASMLTSMLNGVGFCFLLLPGIPWNERRRMLGLGSIAGVCIVLLTAPHWWTFFDTLQDSFNFSQNYAASQLPRPWLVGLFENIFYQQHSSFRGIWGPSANFVLLLGVLLFAACARIGRTGAIAATCLAVIVASFGFIYRWIPNEWVIAIPVIRNIGHVHNVFSCVAIVLMIPPAACGFSALLDRARDRFPVFRLGIATAILAGLLWFYFDEILPTWFGNGSETAVWQELENRGYFLLTTVLMIVGMAGIVFVFARYARNARFSLPMALVALACLIPMYGRHGMYLRTHHKDYFNLPGKRGQLDASSPVVEWMQKFGEGSRIIGVDRFIFPGYSGIIDVEGPNGPDALIPRWHRELARAGQLVADDDWSFLLFAHELDRSRRFFDLFNGKYFVWRPGAQPPVPWLKPVADLDLSVFENPDAWPRAYFTDVLNAYASIEELTHLVESSNGTPFTAVQSGDKDAPVERAAPERHEARSVVAARDFKLTNNTTTFTVEAPGPGFVTLLEAWETGSFRVTLNGTPARCFRANHGFKAVEIPAAGLYRIEFSYWPRHFTPALLLSAAGLVLAVFTTIFHRRGVPLKTASSTSHSLSPMTVSAPNPTSCPICSGTSFRPVRPIGAYMIQRCASCGVQITDPQPSDAALGEIYGRDYFIGAQDPALVHHASQLKRATAARYLQLLSASVTIPGQRLLEIGSGHGDFLVEAVQAGYEVTGVEYSEHACGIIRSRLDGAGTVIRGEVDAVRDRVGAFDVCVLNDVIEHVRQPGELLATIHQLLAPGGVLFVATPSIDSWSARLLGRRWMEYKEEHLTYFGPRQLARLLRDRGFESVYQGPGRKILSIDYVTRHFEHYPVPVLTPLLRLFRTLTPKTWRTRELNIVASGMTFVATRRDM